MKNSQENIIQDAVNPEKIERGFGIEISENPEFEALKITLSALNELIIHDTPITSDDLEKINSDLEKIQVNVGGEIMTVEETEKYPDLDKQFELFKKIKEAVMMDKSRGLSHLTSGLTLLPPEIAEVLSKNEAELWFDSLKSISDESARYLSVHGTDYRNGIRFKRLTEISEQAAVYFSQYKGMVEFNGFTALPDNIAEKLSNHKNYISFDNLEYLSDEAAEFLSKHEGGLSFEKLHKISDSVAKCLSKSKGFLSFKNIEVISDEAIRYLSESNGELSLNVNNLSDIGAEYLSKNKKRMWITLTGSISDNAAQTLAGCQSIVAIYGSDEIKAKIAKFKK